MTKFAFRAALVALGLAAAAPAMAADANFGVTLNGGVVSDYTFRGISQTNEEPAAQGGVEAALAPNDWLSIYAGVWASSVDFGNGTDAEIDLTGGFRGTFDKLGIDLGFIRYLYKGNDSGLGATVSPNSLNFTEFKALASYDLGFAIPSIGVYYSPDFYANTGSATYYTAGVAVPIPVTEFSPTIKANIGQQHLDNFAGYGLTEDKYIDYNIGLFASYLGFTAGVQFVDTDLSKAECGGLSLCESRVVFSLNYAYTF